MILHLVRRYFSAISTVGTLYVDGNFECWTLEDRTREGPKVQGETAIPGGTYKVIVDFSNRFQRMMPHLLDVPGFTGIRIHSGNTAADTEGCILVGQYHEIGSDIIGRSKLAFDALFPKLQAAIDAGDQIQVSIYKEEA